MSGLDYRGHVIVARCQIETPTVRWSVTLTTQAGSDTDNVADDLLIRAAVTLAV